jgi:hypothetical protein
VGLGLHAYGQVLTREKSFAWAEIMRTKKQSWTWIFLLASLALVAQSSVARAQDDQQDQNDQDPPSRVARLNFLQGSVSFQPAGEGDWVAAEPNRPMVTGDNLWADEDSRAEVHVGSAALHLGAQTGITFLDIEDNATQIRLAQGSLLVRVRHVDDDDAYEIDTPNLALSLVQPGTYRIDVSADGNQTIAKVFHGRARATGGGYSYSVLGGQSATFTGSDNLNYDLEQLPDQDDFDQWAFDRDDREDQADSANYVSREMTGYEDLDANGDWTYVAGYGECWRPRAVVVGWAPYRFGHWAWVGPWGWTWVEDEPWGFAPFHYGRWAAVNGGWFWVPGPVVVRPLWAPALVAFVGGGPGFRFSAGVGVGWFPLGPGEVFVPSYRVSRTYVNNVNVTNTSVNITQVTNVYNTVVINKTVTNITYANQRVNGGVTVVSHDAFVNARPVAQNIMRVEPRELAAAPVTHVVAVEPVRQSVVGAGRPAAVRPPAAVISRPVVAQRTPPPPPRSIEQRQAQAGGHLTQQPLVRPEPAGRPYQPNPAQPNRAQPNQAQPSQAGQPQQPRPAQPAQEGFHPFAQQQPNNPVKQTQPAPRVYEQQGSQPAENRNPQPQTRAPEPETRPEPMSRPQQNEARPIQPQNEARPMPQQNEMRPAPVQQAHPLVRPTPPVMDRSPEQEQQQEQKFRNWQQQRPAPAPAPAQPPKQNAKPPEPKPEKPAKK